MDITQKSIIFWIIINYKFSVVLKNLNNGKNSNTLLYVGNLKKFSFVTL